MGTLQDNIRNAASHPVPLMAGNTNAPQYYTGRQKQYLAAETQAYYERYLKYASDFFEAEAQGLDYDDFYAWHWVKCRLADVVKSTSLTNITEDFKQIIFENAAIDYFGRGAKVKTCGNTYISVNPSSISSVKANALIRRCQTTWNFYDYYLNIISEPFCWTKPGALATADSVEKAGILMDAYQHSIMQKNAQTAWIHQDSRVILGNQAWRVRGMTDFLQDFTDDPDVHIMFFDLAIDEVHPAQDDMANRIADGLTQSWVITIASNKKMNVGETQTATATSVKNGVTVQSSAEYPISYVWTSSNEDVATVDENGTITAISEGNATITCALEQNPNITQTFDVAVSAAITTDCVTFDSAPPQYIESFDSATISATYYHNGIATQDTVQFSFGGANVHNYDVTINGNSATISCYGADSKPLHVVASCNGMSISADIALIGY